MSSPSEPLAEPWRDPQPVRAAGLPLPGRSLLDQRWRDLTFLHWRVDPAVVAPLLPPGVRPDVFDSATWVGLIPFQMSQAGFGSGPGLPYVGTFPETNVRFYSVDAYGRRGVVFGSLEASRLPFVLGARAALGLNYTWSRMRIERRDGLLTYTSRRRWPAPRGARTTIVVRPGSTVVQDDPLADFLTARYGLHTRRFGRTLYLPNTHTAWPLVTAELVALDDELLAAAGLGRLADRAPDSVLFSHGVRTRFGGPLSPPAAV
ncbi:MAG: hypothetical protein JWP61_2394 [Friedmanniella sp.]|nr:hypothetical protein [Friedmanniella sp.]